MSTSRTTHSIMQRQRGAVFIVMLVFMIMGVVAFLVSSLNSSAIQIRRAQATADALAQAREALIGYAVSDSNRPGELPCPDFNNDGVITIADYNGSNCQRLVGWLPWKSLGLPDLRDANGDRLWYAVADPFHAGSSLTLNSDTPTTYPAQMLTVKDGATGVTLETGVIAIVFSPGSALTGETRSPNDNNATNAVQNYLEGDNSNFDTAYQTGNDKLVPIPPPIVNDRLLTISYSALLQPVEMRIAREVKACLDGFAAAPVPTNGNLPSLKYPWAAPVTDPAYNGTLNTYFGRMPNQPNTSTSSGGTTQASLNAALSDAGNAVIALRNLVPSVHNQINTAGDWAVELSNGQHTVATVLGKITAANNAVNLLPPSVNQTTLLTALAALQVALNNFAGGPGGGTTDNTMLGSWASVPTCNIMSSPYWIDWKDLVFYQVANGYQPGSGASFGIPLTINGSGTYRATVAVARRALPSQTPRNFSSDASYLEANAPFTNQHQTTPSTNFITYSPSSPNYSTVNDLVLCLDGKGSNPGSVCQ